MSALPSELTVAQIDCPPAALGTEAAETGPAQPWPILRAVGEHVRALFLAQRSLGGQVGDSAWIAEDDHARFSNRLGYARRHSSIPSLASKSIPERILTLIEDLFVGSRRE
jgi:hypothetical protein